MHRRSLAVLVLVCLSLLAYQATRPKMSYLYGPQNFDALTVGTLPTGWVNISTANFLVQTAGNVTSPNALGYASPVDNSICLQTGISAVADMKVLHSQVAGGLATANGYMAGVVARSNSAASNCYVTAIDFATLPGTFYLFKRISGTYTVINGGGVGQAIPANYFAGSTRNLANGDKLYLELSAQGTTIEGRIWLTTDTRPSSPTASATDSSVTAAGYGGVRLGITAAAPSSVAFDDFSIADFAAPPTAGTLSNTALGGKTASFSLATNSGGTAPYSSQLQRSPTGAGTWTPVGTVATGTTATFTDFAPSAATAYDYRVTVTDNASATATSNTVTVTTIGFVAATDTKIACYGRVGVSGSNHVSITNGAAWELSYTGNVGKLTFDTSTAVNFPAISYWLDGVGPTRATLDYTGLVTLGPTYNTAPAGTVTSSGLAAPPRSNIHFVRIVANIESEYPSTFDNWGTQRDALKFMGVSVTSGEGLIQVPTNPNQIEFLGDSITAGLRLLFTSTSGDGVVADAPEINWPRQAADILGMKPLVNGHGGQGITTTGTDGTPIANSAFPYVYGSTAYSPTYKPVVVVVYQGTNDSAITQAQYQTFLTTIRAAYPSAYIFAVVPFQVTSTRRTNILAAVTAQADARVFSLDYSAAFTVNTDTSDATHFNPGGAVRMAAKLATDIQTQLNTSAVKMQALTGISRSRALRGF